MEKIMISIEKDPDGGIIGKTRERFVSSLPRVGDFIYVHGEEDCYVVSEVGFHFNELEQCSILVWVKEPSI